LSLATAATLVMLYGLGGLLYASTSQRLVQRLGEKGLALWGGVLVSVSLLAIAFAPAWWWSIPGCFITGLGFYMLHNTLQINATQMAPERRGAAVASFSAFFYLGQSVGVGVAGILVGQIGTSLVICIGGIGVLLTGFNFSRLRARR
jgi:predicted MFS family arabinose efflux permease